MARFGRLSISKSVSSLQLHDGEGLSRVHEQTRILSLVHCRLDDDVRTEQSSLSVVSLRADDIRPQQGRRQTVGGEWTLGSWIYSWR